ncbi:flippase [Oceanihabitans sediminis]|uniref:flippase n=1 Tax=Oceanihabitans sediminis TaxID=1812012 RepID=UPI003A8F2B4B
MRLKGILENNDYSEVLKKGFIALVIRVLGFLFGYLFIYFTVKLFGAETQGRLSLSFSFMIIGSLFCRLGIDVNFVKIFSTPNNFNNAKGIYFKTVPLVFGLTLIVASSVFLFSDVISTKIFHDKELSLFLKWTSPCIVLFTFILLNASVLRGLRKNAIYSFLFNGGRFIFSVLFLGFFLLLLPNNPVYTVISHTLAILTLFFISFYYLKKHLFPLVKTTTYRLKPFIKDSLPMLFSASMIVFLGWSDTIVLGIYESSETVGFYSVVLKIAAVTSFSFQAIDSILAPKLSNSYHNGDIVLFKKLIKFSTIVNIIVATIVVALILIFREFILGFFGEDFMKVSLVLVILCVGQMFNAICGPVGSILQMTGYQKIFQNILFFALIINIVLNISLVKLYGVDGVAFATAFSLAFWNITAYVYTKKVIRN